MSAFTLNSAKSSPLTATENAHFVFHSMFCIFILEQVPGRSRCRPGVVKNVTSGGRPAAGIAKAGRMSGAAGGQRRVRAMRGDWAGAVSGGRQRPCRGGRRAGGQRGRAAEGGCRPEAVRAGQGRRARTMGGWCRPGAASARWGRWVPARGGGRRSAGARQGRRPDSGRGAAAAGQVWQAGRGGGRPAAGADQWRRVPVRGGGCRPGAAGGGRRLPWEGRRPCKGGGRAGAAAGE